MAVSIRLSRGGSKKRPYYRIVVADARSPRDGNFIERLGSYNPLLAKDDANRVVLNVERAKHWLSVGAQATERLEEQQKKAADAAEAAAAAAAVVPEPEPEPVVEVEPVAETVAETVAEPDLEEAAEEALVESYEVPLETVAEEPAAELPSEAIAEPEVSNEGVSATAPAEGAVEPQAEAPVDESASALVEGPTEKPTPTQA